MAAVLADVVIPLQIPALVANDDDILTADIDRQVTARFEQLALVTGAPPVTVKDRFLFAGVSLLVQVTTRRDGIALLGVVIEGDVTAL